VAVVQCTFTHKKYTEQHNIFDNCNWVDTRWQQYSTHLHTNNTQNTENATYITIKKIGEKYGPCPFFARYTLKFAIQTEEIARKTSFTYVTAIEWEILSKKYLAL
jgi:hypothetical protein